MSVVSDIMSIKRDAEIWQKFVTRGETLCWSCTVHIVKLNQLRGIFVARKQNDIKALNYSLTTSVC